MTNVIICILGFLSFPSLPEDVSASELRHRRRKWRSAPDRRVFSLLARELHLYTLKTGPSLSKSNISSGYRRAQGPRIKKKGEDKDRAVMQITLKTLQQQTIQIDIDDEQTVFIYALSFAHLNNVTLRQVEVLRE